MGTQLTPKGAQPPVFGPCLLWPNGCPSQLLLSTCPNCPAVINTHVYTFLQWIVILAFWCHFCAISHNFALSKYKVTTKTASSSGFAHTLWLFALVSHCGAFFAAFQAIFLHPCNYFWWITWHCKSNIAQHFPTRCSDSGVLTFMQFSWCFTLSESNSGFHLIFQLLAPDFQLECEFVAISLHTLGDLS